MNGKMARRLRNKARTGKEKDFNTTKRIMDLHSSLPKGRYKKLKKDMLNGVRNGKSNNWNN